MRYIYSTIYLGGDIMGNALKPGGCTVRKTPPRGPMLGCRDCLKFDECVELTHELEPRQRVLVHPL